MKPLGRDSVVQKALEHSGKKLAEYSITLHVAKIK